MSQPGSHIFIKVRRCMRSLYDSSSSVSIQPLSRFSARSERRWRSMPATIPGTPAMDSRKMNRTSYFCPNNICQPVLILLSGPEHRKKGPGKEIADLLDQSSQHTHCDSLNGFSATTAVVGLFRSVFWSLLMPVTLSMHHRDVRISSHATRSPSVCGGRWPGSTAIISALE